MRALWVSTSTHSAKRRIDAIHPAVLDLWMGAAIDDLEWTAAGPLPGDPSLHGHYDIVIVDTAISNERKEDVIARTRGQAWFGAYSGG